MVNTRITAEALTYARDQVEVLKQKLDEQKLTVALMESQYIQENAKFKIGDIVRRIDDQTKMKIEKILVDGTDIEYACRLTDIEHTGSWTSLISSMHEYFIKQNKLVKA